MMTGERENCMEMLAKLSFAMDDIRLFLDTHPGDSGALKAYSELGERRKELARALGEAGRPVNFYDAGGQNGWNWTAQPWPWEKEA